MLAVRTKICVLLLLLLPCPVQAAGGSSVGDFLSSCKNVAPLYDGHKDSVTVVQAMECTAYIQGFVEGNLMRKALASGPALRSEEGEFCLPEGVTNRQLALMFVKISSAGWIHSAPDARSRVSV
jgi:hypothetical protein